MFVLYVVISTGLPQPIGACTAKQSVNTPTHCMQSLSTPQLGTHTTGANRETAHIHIHNRETAHIHIHNSSQVCLSPSLRFLGRIPLTYVLKSVTLSLGRTNLSNRVCPWELTMAHLKSQAGPKTTGDVVARLDSCETATADNFTCPLSAVFRHIFKGGQS